MKHDNDNAPRLMAPKDAAKATTLSRTLLTAMAKEGRFPAPVQLTEKRVAFVRAEVEAWISSHVDGRVSAMAAA